MISKLQQNQSQLYFSDDSTRFTYLDNVTKLSTERKRVEDWE